MNVRRLQLKLTVLFFCLLCACSSTRLTYEYLDWIIDWYLDDYLSLSSSQNEFYEQRLNALLQWHRTEQLPRYIGFLEQLEQDLRGPPSSAILQERYGSIQQFWRDIMERAAPECAELLLRLDRRQRLDFYAAGEKKQKKLESKYAGETAAERSLRHVHEAEKMIRRFSGPLTAEQKNMLERWSEALMPLQSLWLENRRTWQQSLQSALESAGPEAEKRSTIKLLFVEPERLWASAYREAIRRNEAATLSMIGDLLGSLTARQKQHALARLDSVKKDFLHLSKG